MTRSSRDDYERYLTRRRSQPARGATLSPQDFEQLLRKLDQLCIADLERALSHEERASLDELRKLLEIDDEIDGFEEDEDSQTARFRADEGDALEDIDGLEIELEELLEPATKDEDLTAFEPRSRHSRLGSPRPDARNRRSLWQQRRRGSRPC